MKSGGGSRNWDTGTAASTRMDFVDDERGTSTTVAAKAASSEERILPPCDVGSPVLSPIRIHAKTEVRVESSEM